MPFHLSRLITLGVIGWLSVAIGFGFRIIFATDQITTYVLGAGSVIFALLDVRFWNVLDTANDILDSDEPSAKSLAELHATIKLRKKLLWERWYSSFLSLIVVALCTVILQFSPTIPINVMIVVFATGYCWLGGAFVLVWWMGNDLNEFQEFRSDKLIELKAEKEWEEEVKRMTDEPKPDFSKDEHLKGYGAPRVARKTVKIASHRKKHA